MATRGYENFTALDVAKLAAKHSSQPKRSKYRNVKTTADGLTFDSAKEARRYQELFGHPDCNTFSTDTPDDILAAARQRVAARRHG